MKKELICERKKLLRSVEELLKGPMIFLGFGWLILPVIELVGSIRTFTTSKPNYIVIFIDSTPCKVSFLKTG